MRETLLHAYLMLAIAHSSNCKTGDIAQTYTAPLSCPNRCAFKKSGSCFAMANFHCHQNWERTNRRGKNVIGADALADWVKENTEENSLIRHNVAGDIASPNSDDINADLLETLISAFENRRAYTYTHCEPNERNINLVKNSNARGFTINFSCESLKDADSVMDQGVPAVVAVPAAVPAGLKVRGRRVINCPAQTHESITCKTCGLCARAGRGVIVAFAAHGSKKAIAIKVIGAANS